MIINIVMLEAVLQKRLQKPNFEADELIWFKKLNSSGFS